MRYNHCRYIFERGGADFPFDKRKDARVEKNFVVPFFYEQTRMDVFIDAHDRTKRLLLPRYSWFSNAPLADGLGRWIAKISVTMQVAS